MAEGQFSHNFTFVLELWSDLRELPLHTSTNRLPPIWNDHSIIGGSQGQKSNGWRKKTK